MTAEKAVRLTFGLSTAVLFVWRMFRQIKLHDVKHVFGGTELIWIIAALIAFAGGYACRIERWRLMLERDNPGLKWRNCAGPLLGSFAANNVLPFRAGDALRAFAFNRTLRTSAGVIVATLLVERLLDLLMVLALLGAALVYFGGHAIRVSGVSGAVLLVAAAVILIFLLCPNLFAPSLRALGRLSSRASPRRGQVINDEISKSVVTLQHLANGTTMIRLICWSVLAWVAEGGVFCLAALALPSITRPSGCRLALPVGTLATLIPSTPGYVGTFDYFTARAMVEVGNSSIAATAYALLVHALLWLPPTLIGGVYLLLQPVKLQQRLRVT